VHRRNQADQCGGVGQIGDKQRQDGGKRRKAYPKPEEGAIENIGDKVVFQIFGKFRMAFHGRFQE